MARPLLAVAAVTLAMAACTDDGGGTDAPSTAAAPAVAAGPPRTVVEGDLALDAVVRGDCLQGIVVGAAQAIEVTQASLVSCARPHELEVFATYPLRVADLEADAGEYPGRARIQRAAEEGCNDRFEESFGEADDVGLLAFWPTQVSWGVGDRDVACVIYPRSGDPFVGARIDR